MWMVGYNEGGGDQLNMVVDHSFSGRKLRPLIPRPMTSSNNYSSTTTTTPCLSRNIHGHDFFSQYHHHHLLGEQNKRDNNQFNAPTTPVVVSSRWNPTPEQLRALEELYRRGTRTPSAEQIQHITAQLRRFGKIEGKNVFYWFQNHKARERQKRRRQMESSASDHHNHHHHQGHNNNNHRDYDALEKKEELAASSTVLEVEQTKNWAPSTNCSTLAEGSVSIQRAAKAGGAECRSDGWLQFDEGELQQRRNFIERNATWHMLQQSSCPAPAPVITHLINTLPNAAIMATTTSTTVGTSTTTTTMDPTKLIKKHDLSFFISTQRRKNGATSCENDDNCVESQTTLQLFPLRRGGDDDGSSDDNINDKETDISASAVNANNNLAPSHFFEFLPLKN